MKQSIVKKMVGIAILAAIVALLQLFMSTIRFGIFSSASLVLIPIVVGAAVYGPGAGAILGGVFSLIVIFQPETLVFHQVTVLGTVLTVLLKGVIAGTSAGIMYKLLRKFNEWVAVIASAAICPVANTLIFSVGCKAFFWEKIAADMTAASNGDSSGSVAAFFLTAYIGINFVMEFLICLICAPIILRILKATKKMS